MDNLLREDLARLIHYQWSCWADFQIKNFTKENVDRWNRQINTDYEKLSETEKDKDRFWADEMLKILRKYDK